MIIATSIAPQHSTNQEDAIKSWLKYGYKIYSFNHISEKPYLQPYEGVEYIFIQTDEYDLYKRHLCNIYHIIVLAAQLTDDYVMLINSDIIIKYDMNILSSILHYVRNGLVICRRINITPDGNKYEKFGIDFFLYNKKDIGILKPIHLAIGIPFWDYWLPYSFIISNKPVYILKNDFIYHKHHRNKWRSEHWYKAAEQIQKSFGFNNKLIKKTALILRSIFEPKLIAVKQTNKIDKVKKYNPCDLNNILNHKDEYIRKNMRQRRNLA